VRGNGCGSWGGLWTRFVGRCWCRVGSHRRLLVIRVGVVILHISTLFRTIFIAYYLYVYVVSSNDNIRYGKDTKTTFFVMLLLDDMITTIISTGITAIGNRRE